MSDLDPEIEKTLSKETIDKVKKLQEEYKPLISANRYRDRLKSGRRPQGNKEKVELYRYNDGLNELLNNYIASNTWGSKVTVIKGFIDKVLDYKKNKKINIVAFNKGYNAIMGKGQITTEDMDELMNADLPIDLRIPTPDCKATPSTCNYKYFLKSFYNLLNKEHKVELLIELLAKVKSDTSEQGGKSVNTYVDKSKETAVSEGGIGNLIKNKTDIGSLLLEEVISIFKALRDKEILNSLKDEFGKEVVNNFRATCYNRIHYYINQDILKLEHTFNTLKKWHADTKRKPVKAKKIIKDAKYNNTRRRSYYLNKEYALLRQSFYNDDPEIKKRKKEYYANYTTKIVNKALYRRKNNLRTQIYRLLNKDRVDSIVARYNERKKENIVRRK